MTPNRYPSAYHHDLEVKRTVRHLAEGAITDGKIEWLAIFVHKRTPWAGQPIAWEDLSGKARDEALDHAEWALKNEKGLS